MCHEAQVEEAEAKLRERMRSAEGWDAECEDAAVLLIRALLAGEMSKREIVRKLRSLGLSERGARELTREVVRSEDRGSRRRQEPDIGTPVCPHCLAPVGRFDHFCPKCLGPITAHAAIDPLGQVYSAGHVYRSAMSRRRPRLIVVLGMWLIFAPQVPYLAWGFFLIVSELLALRRAHPDGLGGWLFRPGNDVIGSLLKLFLVGGLAVLYSAILWKATSRYLASRGMPNGHKATR